MLGEKRGIPTLPIIIILVISMAGIGTAHYILFSESVEVGLEIGDKAPNFTTTTLDGENISLKDHRGGVVILNFMAAWDETCESEIYSLKQIYHKYSKENLTIISVSISSKDNIRELKDFRKKNDINWIFVKDVNLGKKTYDTYSVPELFIIDGSGKIYDKGYIKYTPLLKKIESLLG